MNFKYPKLILLFLTIVLAYLLYFQGFFDFLSTTLNSSGLLASFLGGMLFAFGFTAPFSVALFLEVAPHTNIFAAAFIGGMGAVVADMTIFRFGRVSVHGEFDVLKLSLQNRFHRLHHFFHTHLSEKIKKYLLWTFAGIVIASPLPDEIGISMISGMTDIDERIFAIIAYVLNTLGIFAILFVGTL